MGELNTGTAGSRLAIVLTTVIVTTAVLAGGVALATVGLNSVGTAEIRDNSVQGVDIRNNTVTSADIANDSIRTADIKDGAITGIDIRDGTIRAADLAATVQPRWAKIDADGPTSQHPNGRAHIMRGRGVTSAARVGRGEFTVTFDSPIINCGWLATYNRNYTGDPDFGEVAVALNSSDDPFTLLVRTQPSTGLNDPGNYDGFTLHVVC